MSRSLARVLPDPSADPTIDVDRAAAILGIGRASAYRAIDRGEIPHVRVGRAVRVLTAAFLRQYHLIDA